MNSQTTIGCPGCGERNDAGMAFCIFCGRAMSGKPSEAVPQPSVLSQAHQQPQRQAAPAPNPTAGQSQLMTVTCLSCGRSDPLNKEFCIYCGAKAATSAVRQAQGLSTSGVRMQTAINSLESDIRQTGIEPAKPPNMVLPGVLGAFLGLALGGGIAFAAHPTLQAQMVQKQWNPGALVIYANKPAQIMVKSADEKNFLAAATAAVGASGLSSISLDDLPAGNYEVTITGQGGKPLNEKVTIESGKPTVLGYPTELQL
ncbi:MAG: zinc ribbon domain-containing protein [Candidatus Obscuribacterales bacterium]